MKPPALLGAPAGGLHLARMGRGSADQFRRVPLHPNRHAGHSTRGALRRRAMRGDHLALRRPILALALVSFPFGVFSQGFAVVRHCRSELFRYSWTPPAS
jgi:hypothetical protein